MNSEILDFIDRRFSQTDANWMNGNCYWFAKILTERFPGQLLIYYIPDVGHFVAGNTRGIYYDWHGMFISDEKYPSIDDIKENDPLWYERLMRDCVL